MTSPAGSTLVPPLDVAAKNARTIKIAMLSTSFVQRRAGVQAFKEGLANLGYVEGKNLMVQICDAGGRNDRLSAHAAELVRQGVDVIVALGPYAVEAAKAATATTPIVFSGIGSNFALARNERNMTGVVEELIESTTTRLVILKEALPRLSRLGILSNPDNYGTENYLRECRIWAQGNGVMLKIYDVRDPDDVASAFAHMAIDGVEALTAFPDSVIFGQRDRIVAAALKYRLPGVYIYREWVEAGGLMAYGAQQTTILGGPLPIMVHKILSGAKPGDVPIEYGQLELTLNVKTAEAMGIRFSKSLLKRAKGLIEVAN